jgi:putative ABC transport system substrate-binding protein
MLGAAAAWPLTARAEQPALPVIGFLGGASPEQFGFRLSAFRQGLKEAGFVEGQSVAVDYRWAEGQNDRLPGLAAELVQRRVAVIAAAGLPSALAAKAATATVPIVFETAAAPVEAGLVASLNRPGGNATGITNLNVEVAPKRLQLLRELLPKATIVAVLVNPANPAVNEQFLNALQPAARTLGLQLHVLHASTDGDFDPVFASLNQLHADALVIAPDLFLNTRSERLAALSLRHVVPAFYQYRRFAAAGGLVSYGTDDAEYYRLFGSYTGKILKGAKPADLPVEQSTKVDLIINMKTARALGITVPLSLFARADEVIE